MRINRSAGLRNRLFLITGNVLVVALSLIAIMYAASIDTVPATSPNRVAGATIVGKKGKPGHPGKTSHPGKPGHANVPCTTNSPYGFTTIHADQQIVPLYRQLNVCQVRYQYHWDKIEAQPGVFQWTDVDTAVATMNATGIHVDFAIESAPDWAKSQICSADGKHYLPGSTEMATFATILATRYDGNHGHGRIDSFEIGNEAYDQHFTGSHSTAETCRQASNYGPVLQAGYQAIKAVNPTAMVGMFGQWDHNIAHIQKFFTDLYSLGYGPYMDYMNFHYYNGGQDPSVTHGTIPSFDQWWQMMHSIASQYGFASKPIWVTEVGWPTHPTPNPNKPVAPSVQAKYLQYVMNESARSHVIQKVFWFTINYGSQGDNIVQPGGPLPSFFAYQNMVNQMPIWN